jgi:hypothetical protein
MANEGDRELGLYGDWESACAVLQCRREECLVEKNGRQVYFEEVLPYMANPQEVSMAFKRHLRTHK